MEYPGVMIIGTSARAHSSDTSQVVQVEVALIDKTAQGATRSGHPSAYQIQQLPLNDATARRSGQQMAEQLSDDAFVMMGEVQKIDKEKRQIFLANGTIVCYKHLIIAAGSRHTYVGHDNVNEFRTGIQALAEAIRLRRTVTDVEAPRAKNAARAETQFEKKSAFPGKAALVADDIEAELEKILMGKLANVERSKRSVAMGDKMPQVFCEVQASTL